MREIIDRIRLRPKNCVWELTFKCNMRCLHCASNVNDGWFRGDELNLEEALSVCRELHELGCDEVTLSGGEALLRDDWDQIARYLVSLGIRVALISNGFVIDEPMADRIQAAGVYLTALSFDGMETTHNYIRANNDSFRRVIRAIPYLKRRNMRVNLVTHANRMNLPELPAMEDLAVSSGIDVWRIQLGSPLGRMSAHKELMIAPEELPAVADFVVEAKKRNRITISVGDNIGYFSHHEEILRQKPAGKG
ncbi:MAG: radical SAM protein [Candidatus Omnitrophota bacterium]